MYSTLPCLPCFRYASCSLLTIEFSRHVSVLKEIRENGIPSLGLIPRETPRGRFVGVRGIDVCIFVKLLVAGIPFPMVARGYNRLLLKHLPEHNGKLSVTYGAGVNIGLIQFASDFQPGQPRKVSAPLSNSPTLLLLSPNHRAPSSLIPARLTLHTDLSALRLAGWRGANIDLTTVSPPALIYSNDGLPADRSSQFAAPLLCPRLMERHRGQSTKKIVTKPFVRLSSRIQRFYSMRFSYFYLNQPFKARCKPDRVAFLTLK